MTLRCRHVIPKPLQEIKGFVFYSPMAAVQANLEVTGYMTALVIFPGKATIFISIWFHEAIFCILALETTCEIIFLELWHIMRWLLCAFYVCSHQQSCVNRKRRLAPISSLSRCYEGLNSVETLAPFRSAQLKHRTGHACGKVMQKKLYFPSNWMVSLKEGG